MFGIFDARYMYFFGSKISSLCIFGGLQYEGPSTPWEFKLITVK